MVLTQTVNKKQKMDKHELNSGNKSITHIITNEPDICRKKKKTDISANR